MGIFSDFILLLQQSQWLTLIIVALLGLCVGSFLNVVIFRTPRILHQGWRKESAEFWQDESDLADVHKQALLAAISQDNIITLSKPSSRCRNCEHRIRWYENIPLVSWLLLRGKCSKCQASISWRYPFVEIITAILSVLIVLEFGITLQSLLALIFTWILIALAGIDFDTRLLPDNLTFPLAGLGLLINAFGLFVSPPQAILGYILGFLSLWVVAYVYALIKNQQGMGAGDFKLLAALGAWLGPIMLPFIILLSSLLGSIVGIGFLIKKGKSVPFAFGPYIAIAGMIALLYGQSIMSWYLGKMS